MADGEAAARAAGYVLSYLAHYDLAVEDQTAIATLVSKGYEVYLRDRTIDTPLFAGLLEVLARRLDEAYEAAAGGVSGSVEPILRGVIRDSLALWPFW